MLDAQGAATMYLATGISVIPIQPGSKKAAIKWEPFQKRRMSAEESRQHFINGCQVAMVGGTISGNLECLDFDKPDLFQPFLDTVESVNPALRGKLTAWQNTPSGGFHVLFRCSGPVGGNQKLAMSARYKDDQGKLRQDVFIETRGEGGYFLVAPSKGYALHGSPQAPPVLTPEERDLLSMESPVLLTRRGNRPRNSPPEPNTATANVQGMGSTGKPTGGRSWKAKDGPTSRPWAIVSTGLGRGRTTAPLRPP